MLSLGTKVFLKNICLLLYLISILPLSIQVLVSYNITKSNSKRQKYNKQHQAKNTLPVLWHHNQYALQKSWVFTFFQKAASMTWCNFKQDAIPDNSSKHQPPWPPRNGQWSNAFPNTNTIEWFLPSLSKALTTFQTQELSYLSSYPTQASNTLWFLMYLVQFHK